MEEQEKASEGLIANHTPYQMDIYELKNSVLDGEADALSAYIALKEIEKDLADALKKVQPLALEAAQNYGEKTFEVFGAKVTVKNGAGRWGFGHIPQYNEAKERLKKLEELAKQAYNSKSMGMDVVDEDGVIVEPAEYTEGQETISIQLNK